MIRKRSLGNRFEPVSSGPGTAVTEDGMKALALVDSPDHVCCRYRIRAFEPALTRAGGSITYEGMPRGVLNRIGTLAAAKSYDAVLVQRRLLPSWQLRLLRRSARRLIFDFDDAVLYRDSYDSRGPLSRRRLRRFAATMRAVDVVIAGNDFLADCAASAGAVPERIRVIPTCLNPRAIGRRTKQDTPAHSI